MGNTKFGIEQQDKRPKWNHQRQRELKEAFGIGVVIDDVVLSIIIIIVIGTKLDINGVTTAGFLHNNTLSIEESSIQRSKRR